MRRTRNVLSELGAARPRMKTIQESWGTFEMPMSPREEATSRMRELMNPSRTKVLGSPMKVNSEVERLKDD